MILGRLRRRCSRRIVIISAARFLTEESGFKQTLLRYRRFVTRIVVSRFEYRAGHREVDVVADEVHQLERTHLESAELSHCPVYGRHVCDAFFVNPQGFAVKWTSNAIDNEARRIRGQ